MLDQTKCNKVVTPLSRIVLVLVGACAWRVQGSRQQAIELRMHRTSKRWVAPKASEEEREKIRIRVKEDAENLRSSMSSRPEAEDLRSSRPDIVLWQAQGTQEQAIRFQKYQERDTSVDPKEEREKIRIRVQKEAADLRSLDQKIKPEIVLWNGFFNQRDWGFQSISEPFQKCAAPSARLCTITTSRKRSKSAAAVLVHSRNDLENLPAEHPASQKYVFFAAESPEHLDEDAMKNFSKVHFDWISSYRLDSDVPAPYGWLFPRNTSSSILAEPPGTKPFEKRNKTALWVVSNCVTNDDREDVVAALQQEGVDVDVIGRCGSDDPCQRGDTKCNIELMNKYKFVFAFENSRCKGYITEKFWEAMQSAAVPVVLGAPKSDYLAQAPEGSFVYVSDYVVNGSLASGSYSKVAAFLNQLAGSPNRLKGYKAWQSKYDVGQQKFNAESFSPFWCDLCARLVGDGNREETPGYPVARSSSQGHDLLRFLYRDDCDPGDGENGPWKWKDEAQLLTGTERSTEKANQTEKNMTAPVLLQKHQRIHRLRSLQTGNRLHKH